jgi:hypothetical protein
MAVRANEVDTIISHCKALSKTRLLIVALPDV